MLATLSREHAVVRPKPRVHEPCGWSDHGDLGNVVAVHQNGGQLLLRDDHHAIGRYVREKKRNGCLMKRSNLSTRRTRFMR